MHRYIFIILILACIKPISLYADITSESRLVEAVQKAHEDSNPQAMIDLVFWQDVSDFDQKKHRSTLKKLVFKTIESIEPAEISNVASEPQFRDGIYYRYNLDPKGRVKIRYEGDERETSFPYGIANGKFYLTVQTEFAPESFETLPGRFEATAQGYSMELKLNGEIILKADDEIKNEILNDALIKGYNALIVNTHEKKGLFAAVKKEPPKLSIYTRSAEDGEFTKKIFETQISTNKSEDHSETFYFRIR